ncbi:NifU family protein [Bacteroidota bacterium]
MDGLENISDRIKTVLERLRPFLEEDGGGIEFVRFEEETSVAEVRFTGNCKTCPLMLMTLRGGIERSLIKEVPEIRRVEAVK